MVAGSRFDTLVNELHGGQVAHITAEAVQMEFDDPNVVTAV